MDKLSPIYTEQAQCRDCYKCVRHCPVKAIKVVDGIATVEPERCIFCGRCVEICPVGAKKIRPDLDRAKKLLTMGNPVYVSLAPSWRSEFDPATPGQIIHALKKLGFAGVSETALGAQLVSAACADQLKNNSNGLFISSACPVVNNYLTRYRPDFAKDITRLYSPVIAHAALLKREFGEEISVVFISPCIAKKQEASEHKNLLDVALTFEDLRNWLAEANINLNTIEAEGEFVPYSAAEGALFPLDGGMIEAVKLNGAPPNARLMAFSGLSQMMNSIEGLQQLSLTKPTFVELLACEGGCINGPRAASRKATALKRIKINESIILKPRPQSSQQVDISADISGKPLVATNHTSSDIYRALAQVGKHNQADELNCGGCGYTTCREFAAALLDGRAEPSMCVSYMRKLASNKANALIKAMPSGVVIVDDQLKIIECNERFVQIIGGDALFVYQANPGLEGAFLQRLVPFHRLYAQMLDSREPVLTQNLRHNGRVLNLTLFVIEKSRLIGSIIQDITNPVVQRDHIITRAREVISKNLTTVQQIAFLLGENASESEVLLQEIIDSFTGPAAGNQLNQPLNTDPEQ